MAKDTVEFNGKQGVWRTVSGRKIFIAEGEDLRTAMKNSGKFKSNFSRNKKNIDIDAAAAEITELAEKTYKGSEINSDTVKGLLKSHEELKDKYTDKQKQSIVKWFEEQEDLGENIHNDRKNNDFKEWQEKNNVDYKDYTNYVENRTKLNPNNYNNMEDYDNALRKEYLTHKRQSGTKTKLGKVEGTDNLVSYAKRHGLNPKDANTLKQYLAASRKYKRK